MAPLTLAPVSAARQRTVPALLVAGPPACQTGRVEGVRRVVAVRTIVGVLLVLAAVLAAAAVMTRPTGADFDAMVERALRDRIAAAEVGATGGTAVGTLALVGCKLRPDDCVRLLRGAMTVRVTRGVFTTRVEFEGLNRRGSCLGAFGRFWCDAGIAGIAGG